jgi:DNA replication licensing factor MCM5
MDRGSVYTHHLYEPTEGQNSDTNLQVEYQLEKFILDFRLDNKFVYR